MPIFKFFSEEAHALRLINRGEMLWTPLSRFRAIEDGGVRGDPRDGALVHAPDGGLDARGLDGKPFAKLSGARRFIASVRSDDIFVYCASNVASEDLAREFGRFCVEISDVDKLSRRIMNRKSRKSKLSYEELAFRAVDYRPLDKIPAADWADPAKVSFIKPPEYKEQNEFRFALPKIGAFQIENMELTVEFEGAPPPPPRPKQAPIFIHIGNISDFTTLHRY